jgi:hypothetical protein
MRSWFLIALIVNSPPPHPNPMSDQINDLIARVAALEHAANGVLWPEGQPPVVKKPSAVALDHPPGATKMVSEYGRPTSTNLRSVWGWHGVDGVYDLGYRDGATQATCPHIVTSGEGTSYCALAEQTAAQPRQEREMVPVLRVRRKAGPGCNASVSAWMPSVKDLPIGEHILYAFPGASQPRQEEQPTPPPAPAPHGYAYRYPGIMGGIKFTHGEIINGSSPIEAIPYWLGKPPVDLLTEATPPPAPDDISAALIEAECALADIVEGESDANSPIDALRWAEQRCEAALAIIRPVMKQHRITTSEGERVGEPTPPPAPASGLVERVAEEIYDFTGDHVDDNEASAVIRAVAD